MTATRTSGVCLSLALGVAVLIPAAGPAWALGRPVAPAGRVAGPATDGAGRPDATLGRIDRQAAAAALTTTKLTDARADLIAATDRRTTANRTFTLTQAAYADARTALGRFSRASFIAEAARPAHFATDPRTALFGAPGLPEIDTPRLRLADAEAQLQAAGQKLARADDDVDRAGREVAALRADLSGQSSALTKLRSDRVSALLAAERALAPQFASPAAPAAISFALAQRGKPYLWGAEGPDKFDCSGLVQAAYARADVSVPRTAREQYRASVPVPVTELLPGDLLFFATDRTDWNTIHHVAIYLGDGQMVHAPTEGEVVKVAPVWWTEFFGAGRVGTAVVK